MATRAKKVAPAETLEQRLWDARDALLDIQEPSQYKHVGLGFVFLKYISDRKDACANRPPRAARGRRVVTTHCHDELIDDGSGVTEDRP